MLRPRSTPDRPAGRHRTSPPTLTATVLMVTSLALLFGGALAIGLNPDRIDASPQHPGAAPPAPAPAGAAARPDRPTPASRSSERPPPTPTTRPTPTATPTRTAAPKPAPTPKPTGGPEQQVLALVNQQRAAAGCGALRSDSRLAAAARGHSQDMAVHDYFSHTGLDGSTFVDRIAAAGYPRRDAAAENIAAGYPTASAVMAGWMGSPGHRANILNCGYKAIGIGLAHAANGTAYWTQDFGRV